MTPLNFEQDSNLQNAALLMFTAVHSNQEAALFKIINEYHSSIGLNELTFDGASYHYAVQHSKYIIMKGHTSHDNFTEHAEQIAKITGAIFVAENVAKDYNSLE